MHIYIKILSFFRHSNFKLNYKLLNGYFRFALKIVKTFTLAMFCTDT
jgi:hypothetical protein